MKKRLLMVMVLMALVLPTTAVTMAQDGITSVCLVTDLGRVNDGTFNQYAYEGMVRAAEDLNLDTKYIETQAQTDYEANINTCVDEGFDAIVTVGFLIADGTAAAAAANPDVYFIGVDQFHANPLPNLVGIQFREDQAGFLVGALAAQMTQTGKIAGVYGIDIPPVKKFRNGFEQGARYINPDIELAGVYIPDFVAPQLGAEAAEQFVADGFDVIFGAGGPTGSGGIVRAAELGAMVIGVDQDEWFTTFGEGETPGADKIITSALKRVDQGVYDMIALLAAGEPLPEGSLYLMDAAVSGVGFAPAHDAVVPEEVTASVEEILAMLASGELSTGVDPVTGDLEGPMAIPTIGEVLLEDSGDFTVLRDLVVAAGLLDVLSDPNAQFTVFAPTDEAFAAVPAEVVDALLADPALLTRVLTYHVVSGLVSANDLAEMAMVGTLEMDAVGGNMFGSELTVTVGEDGTIMVDGATVIIPDLAPSNGIIHVIDSVLVPADVLAALGGE
jgi:basic membrane lipoprotein Med (substrate-binding protein (PBP1-ABC) superfamily)